MKPIKKEKIFLTHSYFKYPLPEEMLKDLAQYEASADRGRLSKVLVNCLNNGVYSLNYSAQQLDKASLVWICNPNNPTGTRIPRDNIINILQGAKGMVIVDECNYEYLGETV